MFQGIEEVGFRDGNLARLEGKPLVLNFWAVLCPSCRVEMPQFQVFYEEFKDQIQLVGIDIGVFTGLDSRNDADALLRELGVTNLAGLRTAVFPANSGLRLCQRQFLSAPTARSRRRA